MFCGFAAYPVVYPRPHTDLDFSGCLCRMGHIPGGPPAASRAKVWFAKRKGTDKRPKKRRAVKKQRDIPVPEETPSVLVEGSELERLLLGHISCRISEKLKSAIRRPPGNGVRRSR